MRRACTSASTARASAASSRSCAVSSRALIFTWSTLRLMAPISVSGSGSPGAALARRSIEFVRMVALFGACWHHMLQFRDGGKAHRPPPGIGAVVGAQLAQAWQPPVAELRDDEWFLTGGFTVPIGAKGPRCVEGECLHEVGPALLLIDLLSSLPVALCVFALCRLALPCSLERAVLLRSRRCGAGWGWRPGGPCRSRTGHPEGCPRPSGITELGLARQESPAATWRAGWTARMTAWPARGPPAREPAGVVPRRRPVLPHPVPVPGPGAICAARCAAGTTPGRHPLPG